MQERVRWRSDKVRLRTMVNALQKWDFRPGTTYAAQLAQRRARDFEQRVTMATRRVPDLQVNMGRKSECRMSYKTMCEDSRHTTRTQARAFEDNSRNEDEQGK